MTYLVCWKCMLKRLISFWLWMQCVFEVAFHQGYVVASHQHDHEYFDSKDFDNAFAAATSYGRNYVTVFPTQVDQYGRFLSYDVALINRNDSSTELKKEAKNFYFSVRIKDYSLMLNVSENKMIFHPNFVVERFNQRDEKKQSDTQNPARSHRATLQRGTRWPCHMRGRVIGHRDSVVAISTCNGLNGLIRLKSFDYFIEPSGQYDASDTDHTQVRPHKVYRELHAAGKKFEKNSIDQLKRKRRSIYARLEDSFQAEKTDRAISFCGVTDTGRQYQRSLRQRRLWERRRIHKTQRNYANRKRRSLSLEHWIETLVVVDHKMVEHYKSDERGDVERYVLTIINMVAELFHDVSIGNSLHLTLIRLIILEDEEEGLNITSHAEKTLDSFCRWAKRMNPQKDQHANHHDVAVLLTRQDLCSNSNKSCETLGLAHVAGMCQPHRSCNVNQDTGLSLAYTVAHELGHNFAMHHDGQLNNCEPNDGSPRVMAPQLTSNNLPMRWSACSRRYITRFLDRNWGFCLMDKPAPDRDSFNFPVYLPGVMYDVNHQCRLMFGPGAKHCKKFEEPICTRLWCYYKGMCRTKFHSAAPGTKCAPGRWCYDGACIQVSNLPLPVHGSWGPWTEWSRCSRTCGVGVSHSARYCNQPTPGHGGKFCLGERRRYKTCNVWSCPRTEMSLSFRTEQCAEFNNIPYRNKTYNWFPVDSPVYPCELHCYTRDGIHPFADRLRDKVIDGTKCFSHGKDICVDGICKRLGCDLKIDSLAVEDRCGVCRGSGTSCTEVKKNFTLQMGNEYVPAGVIPKGASKIEVTEMEPSRNFLALRNAQNKSHFFLNGNFMIQHDYQFDLAGTIFKYKRVNETIDNITAEGPISHDIVVMVLFVEENPGINIAYIMPHNVSSVFNEHLPVFLWKMQPWSECSTTCGKGIRMSLAVCIEQKTGLVEEDFCDHNARPLDQRQFCENPSCPPEWSESAWQPCSVTCGSNTGLQLRAVFCVRSASVDEQVVLNKTQCNPFKMPEKSRSCLAEHQRPCPVWKVGSWNQCSKSCGNGLRERSVKCVTYLTNDVVNDVFLEEKATKFDNSYQDASSDHDLDHDIASDIEQMTISRVMIIERPFDGMILDDYDYDEEDEIKCNLDTRPDDKMSCKSNLCSVEIARSSSNFVIDPLMSMKTLNNSFYTTIDNDFDTNSSLNFKLNSTVFYLNSSANQLHEDPLDQIILSLNPHSDHIHNSTDYISQNETSVPNDLTVTRTTTSTIIISTTTARRFTGATAKPKWFTGVWGQCSTTCGVGARIRNVVCSGGIGQCDINSQPAPAQRCHLKPCTVWKYVGWTKCSRTCGKGHKRRKVQCRKSRTNQLLRPFHCRSNPRLRRINSTCHVRACRPWKTSSWNRCNVACGVGVQRRRVACVRKGWCDPAKRPATQKNCKLPTCSEWRTYHWGRCPVNCGYGIKKRIVLCQERETGAISHACIPQYKPPQVKKCIKGPCRVTDFDFSSCVGDSLKTHFCKILRKWGKCLLPSLAFQCCHTCKTYITVRQMNKIS